jgi:glycosyltransferase involved in cell wall biosynthesis
MKIAMIGQKGIPAHSGGIERHVEELSIELSRLGNEVLVFCRCWYTGPVKYHRGVRCITVPSLATKHFDAITHTFLSILRAAREQVDVFHIHGVGPALLAWLPKLLRPQAKVIVTFHCIDRHHQKWNWFARMMLHIGELAAHRFPDVTISVSRTLQAYCRMSYGADTVYIPNGTHIPTVEANPDVLKRFGLEPHNYLILCARLVRHKGAHKLIEAWKRLSAKRPELVKGKKVAIVGGSAFTDSYVTELEALAKDTPSIVLTGAQTGETLNALFAGSYAAVHPSTSEGLPIAVLEAMSYGKCVLSSDIPENLELTRDHGLSFRTDDIDDLVEKLTMMLEHPELVEAVGRESREYVAKHFGWEDIASMTSSLYEVLHVETTTCADQHLAT